MKTRASASRTQSQIITSGIEKIQVERNSSKQTFFIKTSTVDNKDLLADIAVFRNTSVFNQRL
jgi:hypothetical protein